MAAGVAIVKVCVYGLWHLGCVTAACLASIGHQIAALDVDAGNIERLRRGEPPLYEPGLAELLRQGINDRALSFTTDPREALADARALWVAFDTPVDDDDRADTAFVLRRVESIRDHLQGKLVLLSSQLPAGSVRQLEQSIPNVRFACLPENLRLGKAVDAFMKPDRIVAGTRSDADRALISELLAPLHAPFEWMSVESAEMTKHALNAFLATSIAFINEIAVACEQIGADAKEVERGLKSDARIGPRAYLSPGGAFAGGTLARDLSFLATMTPRPLPLIRGVKSSNDQHKEWPRTKLRALLGSLRGRTVAVWGLTYKPGTDTLRRSASVELCRWLLSEGANVKAHDPAVRTLPAGLAVALCSTAEEAVSGADALVIATQWEEYRSAASSLRDNIIVIDANRFVAQTVTRARIRYVAVGI